MTERLRLLLTNTNYRSDVVGGGQLSVQVLAEGLAAKGHEVTVASVGTSAADEVVDGVRHVRLLLQNDYWPFDGEPRSRLTKLRWHMKDADNGAMADQLRSLLGDLEPDLLHTNVMTGFSSAIWRSAAALAVPVVHTLRDYYVVCSRSSLFRGGRPCSGHCLDCRLLTKSSRRLSNAVNTVDAVVGNSRNILDTHLRLGAFNEVPLKEVVFNAYSGPHQPSANSSSSGRLRLGFLGRLAPHKGIELLLETVQRMPENNVELKVAGGGDEPYVRALKERFEDERIAFLGFVPPTELLSQVDVLVVPSLWPEPLPRTVFEAYAHGVPVIGSNRGGTPEIIESGITGLVFDPADPTSLEAAIGKIMTDRGKLDEMRVAALEKAKEFLPERVVEHYLEVYRTVLARRRAGVAS